jgi:hypothetical protein
VRGTSRSMLSTTSFALVCASPRGRPAASDSLTCTWWYDNRAVLSDPTAPSDMSVPAAGGVVRTTRAGALCESPH